MIENPILHSVAFSKNSPDTTGSTSKFWESALSPLISELKLEAILLQSGCRKVKILIVPSFRQQIIKGGNDLYAPVSAQEAKSVVEILRLSERRTTTESVTLGGASIAAALKIGAETVMNERGTAVIAVGAEAISKASGLRTSELVVNAGKSVFPREALTNTISDEVNPTLITAYSLVESAVMQGLNKYGKLLRNGEILPEHPLSGTIYEGEVAASNDGAFLSVIVPDSENLVGNKVYIAAGVVSPGGENHIDWWRLPARFNMAFAPIQKLFNEMELTESDVHTEKYDCFYIALLLQTAATLGIQKIDPSNINRITEFIKKYDPISSLTNWAAWGISSGFTVHQSWEKLKKEGQVRGSKNALIIGNGGVMNTFAATVLSTDERKTKHVFLRDIEVNTQLFELATDPDYLVNRTGKIDMITFQYPSRNTKGTTFVRVVLPDNKVVLTNLLVGEGANSCFEDNSNISIGTEVRMVMMGKRVVAKVI